jgi:hypothetical protein
MYFYSVVYLNFCLFVSCSLLYGAEDPSIACMVLDSAFSNLYDLMMELVEVYKIRVPKFTVWLSFASIFNEFTILLVHFLVGFMM